MYQLFTLARILEGAWEYAYAVYSPAQKFCRTSGQKWQLLITQLLIGYQRSAMAQINNNGLKFIRSYQNYISKLLLNVIDW